jgi:hypothetical protein
MTPADIAKALGEAALSALAVGTVAGIEAESLDAGYARMIERLSDLRLATKDYPDGRYVPPHE